MKNLINCIGKFSSAAFLKAAGFVLLSVSVMTISPCSAVYAQNEPTYCDDSVIAVINYSSVSLFSASEQTFEEIGIASAENLDGDTSGISLMSEDDEYEGETYKLTLSEPGYENVEKVMEELNGLSCVEYVQPNYIYYLDSSVNDTYYIKGNQYGLSKISAEKVWDMDIDCSDVVVAVVDSGIKTDHQDLKNNIWVNPDEIADNGIDDDGNGYVDDVSGWDYIDKDNVPNDLTGHGTHVSGIISAETNNSTGVASLARNAKILPLKVFDATGSSSTSNIYSALKYIKNMNIPVANFSFGGYKSDSTLKKLMKKCSSTLFSVSAGNNSEDNDSTPVYPASFGLSNIISVASTDSSDNLSSFSNYGESSVHIAAPGTAVYSTYYLTSKLYTAMSGTSMAAPMVTSAAAVMKAKFPSMTPAQIISKLEDSADVLSSLDGKVITSGRLNAYEAVSIHAESLELDTHEITLEKGDSKLLSASISPLDTTDELTWSSGNTDVAVVDDGTVTVVGSGSTTVTATCGDMSDTCIVHGPQKSTAYIEDGKLTVELYRGEMIDINGKEVNKDDIYVFAAFKDGGGILNKVEKLQISDDLTAEYSIDEELENSEITVYIWDADCRPFVDAVTANK